MLVITGIGSHRYAWLSSFGWIDARGEILSDLPILSRALVAGPGLTR